MGQRPDPIGWEQAEADKREAARRRREGRQIECRRGFVGDEARGVAALFPHRAVHARETPDDILRTLGDDHVDRIAKRPPGAAPRRAEQDFERRHFDEIEYLINTPSTNSASMR